MDGGLARGWVAVVLAPFGVGKTTMLTKIANTADWWVESFTNFLWR
jgi:ABC-type cobalamin/Fe3+-siderophores transport system ATPase subunit